MLNDLRFALRELRKSPGFAAVAILTLGLGIGAAATIFSIGNALFLRPPARVSEPERLVWIYTSDFSGPLYSASSYPDFEQFRRQRDVLAGAAAFSPRPVSLVDGGRTARIMAELVSRRYFQVLGVRPELGRAFLSTESRAQAPEVVISDALWHRAFGASHDALGRTIDLDGNRFTVVGVAPSGYRGAIRGLDVDVWIPFQQEPLLTGKQDFIGQRGNRGLLVIGRLRDGVGVEEAQVRFRVVAAQLFAAYPKSWVDVRDKGRRITVVPESESRVPAMARGAVISVLGLLSALVGLVLLVCCANVANLLLARAAGRRQEIAVRLSLGAARRRLVRQLLTESLLLAAVGAIVGLLVALWGVRLLPALIPPLPIPVHLDLHLDWRVLAFAATVTLLATFLFGLAPALRSTRTDLASTLKDAPSSRSGRSSKLQQLLVIVQLSVSLVLLVGAGLFLHSLAASQRANVGMDANRMVVAELDIAGRRYSDEQRLSFYHSLAARLERVPGVAGVTLASDVPLDGSNSRTGAGVEGYKPAKGEDMEFHFAVVGDNYFHLLHIPIVRGRGFSPADRKGAPAVAVVNQAFATRFWPGENPIGKRLTYAASLKDLTVVGVVPTGKYVSLSEAPTPFIYLSVLQQPWDVKLDIRARQNPERLVSVLRQAITRADPDVPITALAPMASLMAISRLPQRIGAAFLSLFAVFAFLLAAIGLYGVMAYMVSRRKREIGIRMAIGARQETVVRLVLAKGLRLIAVGLGMGIVLAAGLGRLVSRFLFGVAAFDPLTFAAVAVLLVLVGLVASYLPARRAARIDPIEALRHE